MQNNAIHTISPAEYAEQSAFAQYILTEMLSRLAIVTLKPNHVVDLGCGTGFNIAQIRQRYPDAMTIECDFYLDRLQYGKNNNAKAHWVSASPETLPLSDHSVDLIVANLLLPWCPHLEKVLTEWRRVLRPEGLFLFSTLGPDTLKEIKHQQPIMPYLIDMHDLGDALIHAGFGDPVLDRDYFTLKYHDLNKLRDELFAMGMVAEKITPQTDNLKALPIALTYEIIFGHAWKPTLKREESGVYKISFEEFRKQFLK